MSKSNRIYALRLERARSGEGVLLNSTDAAAALLGASVFVGKPNSLDLLLSGTRPFGGNRAHHTVYGRLAVEHTFVLVGPRN